MHTRTCARVRALFTHSDAARILSPHLRARARGSCYRRRFRPFQPSPLRRCATAKCACPSLSLKSDVARDLYSHRRDRDSARGGVFAKQSIPPARPRRQLANRTRIILCVLRTAKGTPARCDKMVIERPPRDEVVRADDDVFSRGRRAAICARVAVDLGGCLGRNLGELDVL